MSGPSKDPNDYPTTVDTDKLIFRDGKLYDTIGLNDLADEFCRQEWGYSLRFCLELLDVGVLHYDGTHYGHVPPEYLR